MENVADQPEDLADREADREVSSPAIATGRSIQDLPERISQLARNSLIFLVNRSVAIKVARHSDEKRPMAKP